MRIMALWEIGNGYRYEDIPYGLVQRDVLRFRTNPTSYLGLSAEALVRLHLHIPKESH